jgi:hypothetical protein
MPDTHLRTASSQLLLRSMLEALSAWAVCVRDKYKINPVFAHVDKDMAEIGMLRDVWDPKVQICWWHLKQAVQQRLTSSKLTTTPYNPQRARDKFRFIHESFQPIGQSDSTEHEGGLPDDQSASNPQPLSLFDNPNAIPLHLPKPHNFSQSAASTSTVITNAEKPPFTLRVKLGGATLNLHAAASGVASTLPNDLTEPGKRTIPYWSTSVCQLVMSP